MADATVVSTCAPRAAGGPPRVRDAVAGGSDLRGDALVLPPDPSEKIEVVEEVGEAGRSEDERERVGAVGHVELADPRLEADESDAVLAAKPAQANGLVGDRAIERPEPGARRDELTLEDVEPRPLRVDPGLEFADASRDRAQLLREDARLTPGVRGLPPKGRDPRVDARFLRTGIARRRCSGEEEREREKARGDCLEARSTTHHPLFAVPLPVPSRAAPRRRSRARSASAASRRMTPTTAR